MLFLQPVGMLLYHLWCPFYRELEGGNVFFFYLILGCSGEGIVGLNGIEGEDECQLKTGNVLIVMEKAKVLIRIEIAVNFSNNLQGAFIHCTNGRCREMIMKKGF